MVICFSEGDPSTDEKYDEDDEEEKEEDNDKEDEGEEIQEGADFDESCIWERELSLKCCGMFPVLVGWDHLGSEKRMLGDRQDLVV